MSKSNPTILILFLVVLLGGGGAAAWFVLKREDDQDQEPTNTAAKGEPQSEVGGRTNETELKSALIAKLTAQQSGENEAPSLPPPDPVLATSDEGKRLIEERARLMQENEQISDSIRINHRVGRTLLDAQAYTSDTLDAIKQMMGQIQEVDPENYSTYPIYGRWETQGIKLRQELQNYLDQGWRAFNYTKHGNRKDCWLDSVQLNLLNGTRNAHVHTADQIWWNHANQSNLDWYKKMNGHDVPNTALVEFKNGRPTYAAGYMYSFVQKWIAEIDYFNRKTLDEAKLALINEGLIINVTPTKAGRMNGN